MVTRTPVTRTTTLNVVTNTDDISLVEGNKDYRTELGFIYQFTTVNVEWRIKKSYIKTL